MSDSICQLEKCIQKEASVRKESESQIYNLLEQMCSKIKEQIDLEKGDRQTTEQVPNLT